MEKRGDTIVQVHKIEKGIELQKAKELMLVEILGSEMGRNMGECRPDKGDEIQGSGQ